VKISPLFQVIFVAMALLSTPSRLPAPIQEASETSAKPKPKSTGKSGGGASHWADLTNQQIIGEWQSCGSKSCTSYNVQPDHTFVCTDLSSGRMAYAGDWRTSGNTLFLHVTRTGTQPASKGQTFPLIVMDVSPDRMYTRLPMDIAGRHLWTRRKMTTRR